MKLTTAMALARGAAAAPPVGGRLLRAPLREAAGATTVGLVRAGNEDAHAVDAAAGVLVVCDGVGGNPGGELASRAACAAAAAALEAGATPEAALRRAEAAVAAAGARAALPQMATTIVAARAGAGGEPRLEIASAGDSRAYRCRRGVVTQLTADQARPGAGGWLTNALGAGMPGAAGAGYAEYGLEPGDVVLLCTDGVWGVVPWATLREVLAAPGRDARARADALVRAAMQHGAPDNATAVVAVR